MATASCVSRVLGSALSGVEGVPVEVEVRLSSQLPRIDIVGLPEAAVRESAARVRAALASVGQGFPERRVTVNLAPASVRKSGAGLDLPIAIGILAAAGAIEAAPLAGLGLIGELALDGRVRPVRGALPQGMALQAAGCRRIVGPLGNGDELGIAPGARIELVAHLGELLAALAAGAPLPRAESRAAARDDPRAELGTVRGQLAARRALEIAAAGGHGLLLQGAPGSGKTLLARALPGLLPPLGDEEALEVARIHSAAGLLDAGAIARRERPFRAPHHSASRAGLLGGGSPPRPGEACLAHRGVLFLDELAEFDRGALESLRQVLEEGRLALARAGGRIELPARFQLVAAANPCACGWFRSGVRDCRCDDGALARHAARLSGPLLDRIDLHVFVRPVRFAELAGPSGESSHAVRERVDRARALQRARGGAAGVPPINAAIPGAALPEAVSPTAEATALLARAVDRLGLSARGAHRVLRVARTIADLAGEARVGAGELAEALALRSETREGGTGVGS